MIWPTAPLRVVAPPSAAQITFKPEDTVWQLSLDQIESETGLIAEKRFAVASESGTSTFSFDTGNVLYSKLRPYLNKVVLPDEPGIATTELVPLRPNQGIVNPKFLTYYLRSSGFVMQASHHVAGAKMPRVVMDWFWKHEMPVPTPKEQCRIVEILDEADRLRRLRREADARAARILPALFLKMFGDPASNPQGYSVTNFGSLLQDGPQNGIYKPSSAYGEGTRILRIDGFYAGQVTDLASLKRLALTPNDIEKYSLNENDIVINRVNSIEYLGKSALVPSMEEPVVFESNMMRLTVDPAQVSPVYAIAHLQTPFAKSEILQKAKRAINQASINQQDVRSLTILKPPIELQLYFANLAREIESSVKIASLAGNKIAGLFDAMLQQAFSGQLTDKWRKAHMKELLGEMEHQARALNLPLPKELEALS